MDSLRKFSVWCGKGAESSPQRVAWIRAGSGRCPKIPKMPKLPVVIRWAPSEKEGIFRRYLLDQQHDSNNDRPDLLNRPIVARLASLIPCHHGATWPIISRAAPARRILSAGRP